MIKQLAQLKIGYVFLGLLAFALSYLLKVNLAVPLTLICLVFYLRSRKESIRNYNLLNLSLLYLIIFVAGYFIIAEASCVFCIPFSIVPMLTILLFNNLELALVMSLAISISIASLTNNPFGTFLLSIAGSALAIMVVKGARKRTNIISAGLIIGIGQVITLILLDHFWIGQPKRYVILLINGIASSIIVLGISPVFEYLFKTVTNISLLELADFNHPLLQRMILEAPGTYHHSLVVGNLSDSACSAVGANALLARIGAYYHDIGKLQKPEYYSENQELTENKHAALSPTMSKLIIMNHVKDGIELAKKYKLSPVITDFIFQHHGNSLVYYFYRRALENLEEDEEIKEDGFRYPGPKPNTKETAIVLLADSVEAATRALKDSASSKIEEVVHKVINNKFIDGQLDECDLTLKDLEKISAVFIRILTGIYRSRVSYPEEQKSAENNNKKSSKEDSRLSQKDKNSGS
ncbi:MAG: HDIG domain-containing metalloprotein [Candidatus Omnitrophota bacterium]|jgi:putative nucleotidyltransferase with HDIG domain